VSRGPASALVLRGVVRRLEGVAVLDGVDLDVPAGRLVVLLGESGAGKSTLLRLVAGLDAPDAGRIEVGGRVVADPRSLVPPEARGVGMVFQSLELWPHMTAAENVAFGLPGRPRGRAALADARVREVAAQVGLDAGILPRRPPTLSGGERQRVAIARALAPRPTALLYDEPLAHLDPERRAEIRRLVRDLRATTATTVLYVTHDAAEALEVGDEVAVLAGGRVVERGPPADVYARPRTLAGARALGPVSVLTGRRTADGRSVATALGSFPCPEAAGEYRVLLRPEHVVLDAAGAPARVTDAHPVAGGWQVALRLDGAADEVLGRSEQPVATGASVRVRVRGSPSIVPAVEAAA
jgi:iron(III) transport system ATP-binding protein